MSTKRPAVYHRLVTIPDPAAGVNFVITAPGQELWRVLSVAWVFNTSAAVANRHVGLVADDQTDTWFTSRSSLDVPASSAVAYGAFPGAAPGGVITNMASIALPNDGLLLQPGHRLRSFTANIQGGDTFTAVRALVQCYPQGPADEFLPITELQLTPME